MRLSASLFANAPQLIFSHDFVMENQLVHPCIASFETSLPLKSLQISSSAGAPCFKITHKFCILAREPRQVEGSGLGGADGDRY